MPQLECLLLKIMNFDFDFYQDVCRRPEFERIGKLTSSQCIEELKSRGSFLHNCDHNTAALLERLFDVIRHDSDAWTERGDAESNKDMRRVLHTFRYVSLQP